MVLPLNLAMTPLEMSAAPEVGHPRAWMACQFSPYGEGLTEIPRELPPGSMLILNDRMPCTAHSPRLVIRQLIDTVERFSCESILLDFQQPKTPESAAMVRSILAALPCPAAVTEGYCEDKTTPVFLSPNPLHLPLGDHLSPWLDREIWLEAALCQEVITIRDSGASFSPVFPPDGLADGFFDDALCCCYQTSLLDREVRFTLFDTPETLQKKLALAHSLGVRRAVGLYQELPFL